MAGESIIDYAGQAAIAYQDALNQARNTQNALLRQYGFTAPGTGGEYSVESAQAAFDPNSLFDKATGGVNKAKLAQLAGSLQVGGTGAIADIMRQGATAEADVAAEARSRGLGGEIGGGLMSQRRALAEAQTTGQVGAAKQQFLAGIGEALSPIGSAWQGVQNANIISRMQEEAAKAGESTVAKPIDFSQSLQPVPTESTTAAKPKQYDRRVQNGVKQQYINGKWKNVKV